MKILILILLISLLIVSVPAQEQKTFYWANTSINYNALEDPFLQWQIQQGAEVYTGRSYDITGAIGTSDFIAHWSDWKVEDQNCEPDTIIPVRYIASNGAVDPDNYYINPSTFPTGNYYTWDGCREWTILVKTGNGTFIQKQQGQAPNENRFAFTVRTPPKKIAAPIRQASPPAAYVLPPFAGSRPVQTAVPTPVVPVPQEEPAPWYIQWWWLELVVVGIIVFILNEQLDIL